jgi:anti-sigma factor RsiW
MNENRNAHGFDDAASPRGCERAAEMVTYLYGEASPHEAEVLRGHLTGCAVCREELAAFGGVREAVGVWRAEALGSLPPLDINEVLNSRAGFDVNGSRGAFNVKGAFSGSEAVAVAAEFRPTQARKRSARAALREFFSLSPLWLRAGAFAATLAFCALAALTLTRAEVRWGADGLAFRTGTVERIVKEQAQMQAQVPVQSGFTQEQVNAIVAERLGEAKARWEAAQPQRVEVAKASDVSQRKGQPRAVAKSNAPRLRRTAPSGFDHDDELADLPRLSDLLSGGN